MAKNNTKSNAAQRIVNNAKSESPTGLSRPKSVLPPGFFENQMKTSTTRSTYNADLGSKKLEPSAKLSKPQSSSVLPPNFFDNHEAKRQKSDTAKSLNPDSRKKTGISSQNKVESLENEMDGLVTRNELQTKTSRHERGLIHTPAEITGSETKQLQGALPEGFFDNKEADMLARGIKPVKPDVKDEYKQFEKLIQEDLQEVDDRLEEEEIDAAEMIEEAESLEQKTYREKVELLRKRRMELMAARSAKRSRDSNVAGTDYSGEESSSDDDNDDNFAVDWRAQHL